MNTNGSLQAEFRAELSVARHTILAVPIEDRVHQAETEAQRLARDFEYIDSKDIGAALLTEISKDIWCTGRVKDEVRRAIGYGAKGQSSPTDPKRKGWRDHVTTAALLQRQAFTPISWVIPGLIPEGLSIVAGRPKVGKSWLALDICIAVAAGRFCLGDRKPIQGDVLYCALEDNPRRLQRRIDKLLSPFGETWPERLTLATSWRRLDKGGVDDIQEWIEGASDPRLVILDTLAGVRPIRTRDGYTEDYESLAALHRLANRTGIGLPVLHHVRKMEAEDPFDTISGTLGLSGCADTGLVLNRKSQGTTLYVRGRNIEEAEHAVEFNKNTCRWTILGNASEVHRSDERTSILVALSKAPDGTLSPQEIAGITNMKLNNVYQLLNSMAQDNEVLKVGRGKYRCPDQSDPLDPR